MKPLPPPTRREETGRARLLAPRCQTDGGPWRASEGAHHAGSPSCQRGPSADPMPWGMPWQQELRPQCALPRQAPRARPLLGRHRSLLLRRHEETCSAPSHTSGARPPLELRRCGRGRRCEGAASSQRQPLLLRRLELGRERCGRLRSPGAVPDVRDRAAAGLQRPRYVNDPSPLTCVLHLGGSALALPPRDRKSVV